VIQERDLETGAPSGATLDPQLGDVGALDITSDGSELVSFGGEAPAISRWRLDGTGPMTRRIADGYEPNGEMILVAERPDRATLQEDWGRFAIWDPETNRADHFIEGDLEGAGWLGPGLVGAVDRTKWAPISYDTTSREFLDAEIPMERSESTWPSAGGTRFYALLENPGEVGSSTVGLRRESNRPYEWTGLPCGFRRQGTVLKLWSLMTERPDA
jgi:hypothetical protein